MNTDGMNWQVGEAVPPKLPNVGLVQLVCLRDLLRRGACFDKLHVNEITGDIEYERNGTQFFITLHGVIEKLEEVPVTRYETRRVYVSDRHEEREMVARGRSL